MSSIHQQNFYLKDPLVAQKLKEYCDEYDINKSKFFSKIIKNELIRRNVFTKKELETLEK